MKSIACYFIGFIIVTAGCVGNSFQETDFDTTNEWLRNEMAYYYYWLEEIPDEPARDVPPEFFFDNMLASQDFYSQISNNAEAVLESLNGVRYTAGYSGSFGLLGSQGGVFIVVEFVYPGSFADQAGLKRGDIIIGINGTILNTNNYIGLYYGEGPSELSLGQYNFEENTITTLDSTVTVEKGVLELDPVVHSNVFDFGGQKIGYLFLAEFIEGENGEYLQSINNVMSDFATQGVTDLIVDLRYNFGGSSNAAVNLANAIAPMQNVQNQDTLVHFLYNEVREADIAENQGADSQELNATLSEGGVNLGLSEVFFITTSSTASVSEQLINGLETMMSVQLVGGATAGEFYGTVLTTGLDATPPNNYAIAPVTVKYANAEGVTDFNNGLEPDITETEFLFEAQPIGSLNDPLIAAAVSAIRNTSNTAKRTFTPLPYQLLEDPRRKQLGRILFVRK